MIPTNRKTNAPQTSIVKNSLKFLSWNIQAASTTEGNKFEISDFKNIISSHDFVCLQEIRQDVHLPGFRSVCNLRKDDASGGVGILIKNEFLQGVEFIEKVDYSDYIICRLKKTFFRQPKDIYLVNVYVKPQNSSKTKDAKFGKETLESIDNIINELKNDGEVILCGDFNSRIGLHTGMVKNDSSKFLSLPEDYVPDEYSNRRSQDTLTNPYGTHFLNLVQNNQLTILNGRTLGDLSGNFTSIQWQGCSVIDYFAVSKHFQDKILYLKIEDLTEYSDHKPLCLHLRCPPIKFTKSEPLQSKYQPAPNRFIINQENKTSFMESQKTQSSMDILKSLNDELSSIIHLNSHDKGHRTESIKNINNKFAEHIRNLASESFKETKKKTKNKTNNNPWFNWHTKLAKRELRKATKATSEFPSSEFLRKNFYQVKGSYKRILSKTKTKYFAKLNEDIEGGKILNWQSFKKLKQQKSNKINFDSHDMENFESFFKKLYADNHETISSKKKEELIREADIINKNSINPINLNAKITVGEVLSTIKALKSGKASSFDMISNEILKCLNRDHVEFITNYYNVAFDYGIYPWNENLISVIHKKGKISNPDNYRAISISSAIGKVFSTILLERLIKFRRESCPDPPHQLGFSKGAQTYDHILTMQTIASKYKKLNKPVYAVFVDFKKAFDSVCRQALFYKMAKNGITGKFYNVLRYMYSNSFAHVKLSGHLSNRFGILKEQNRAIHYLQIYSKYF